MDSLGFSFWNKRVSRPSDRSREANQVSGQEGSSSGHNCASHRDILTLPIRRPSISCHCLGATSLTASKKNTGKQTQIQGKALHNEVEGKGLYERIHQTDYRSFWRTSCHLEEDKVHLPLLENVIFSKRGVNFHNEYGQITALGTKQGGLYHLELCRKSQD